MDLGFAQRPLYQCYLMIFDRNELWNRVLGGYHGLPITSNPNSDKQGGLDCFGCAHRRSTSRTLQLCMQKRLEHLVRFLLEQTWAGSSHWGDERWLGQREPGPKDEALSLSLVFIYLFISLTIYLSISPSLSVCLSACLAGCLFVCLSIYLSISLPACLPACLSVSVWLKGICHEGFSEDIYTCFLSDSHISMSVWNKDNRIAPHLYTHRVWSDFCLSYT